MQIETLPIDTLIPYARNSRTHSDEQVAQIAASIREFGFTNPVLIDADGGLIAGHGRVLGARKLGLAEVPCIRLAHLSEAQRRAYVIADNKLALNAGWDDEMLALELRDLQGMDFDLGLTGFENEDITALLAGLDNAGAGGAEEKPSAGKLSDRFMIPPFSTLNAREGWWQNRKRAWLALGIKSEIGRGNDAGGINGDADTKNTGLAAPGGSLMPAMKQQGHVPGSKTVRGNGAGKPINPKKFNAQPGGGGGIWGHAGPSDFYKNKPTSVEKGLAFGEIPNYDGADRSVSGTSIFDPVLCEIAYRWFSPVGGLVLDPFAGGSVRGVVASKLERQYIGHELRPEQVEANRAQGDEICADDGRPPAWIAGDSRNIDVTCADVAADMVFSCPPYADLEVYSDNPKDLSTMKYADFKSAYFEIIKKSCDRLKPDSFACFVVGEVRDKSGNYIDFVGDTVQAFRDAGLAYYNEAILITCVGSLPIRAGKQFSSGRKLGKTHQNILVFVKGSGKKAAARCGVVDVDESMFDALETEQADKYGVPL